MEKKVEKKSVLIIGPIGDHGGREIMTGFISKLLKDFYHVHILSTVKVTLASQVFQIDNNAHLTSVNQLIYEKYLILRIVTDFICFVKNRKLNKHLFVKNKITDRFLGYSSKFKQTYQNEIAKYDIILINAHVSSNHLMGIINEASRHNKKLVFRTTGTIPKGHFDNHLKKVNLFIHHSDANALSLLENLNHEYKVIGQATHMENKLMELPITSTSSRFLLCGRLSKEKGFFEFCDFFTKINPVELELFIVGDGPEMNKLTETYEEYGNIHLLGYKTQNQLIEIFKTIDVVVISSYHEAGPMIGVEAMVAGKILLSTRVGAMPERLQGTQNNYWFDISNFESFSKAIKKVTDLSADQVLEIKKVNRDKYLNEYSLKKINKDYLSAIESL